MIPKLPMICMQVRGARCKTVQYAGKSRAIGWLELSSQWLL